MEMHVARHDKDPHRVWLLNLENEHLQDCQFFGRWLYCRQCKRKESAGGIIVPDKSRDATTTYEVLAIGRGVGKPVPRRRKRKDGYKAKWGTYAHGLCAAFRVGDLVACPPPPITHGVLDSPWASRAQPDKLIHETVPVAILRK